MTIILKPFKLNNLVYLKDIKKIFTVFFQVKAYEKVG